MIEILFQLAESSHFFIIGIIIMTFSTMSLAIAFNFTSGGFSFGSLLLVGAVGVAVGCFMIMFPLTLQLLPSPVSQLILSLVTSAILSLITVFVAAASS